MIPTEFLQNKNIIAEDKTDLIIGFDDGTKESLIDLLEKYHQAKLKLLGLADVSGRSEPLICPRCKSKDINNPLVELECNSCDNVWQINCH